MKDRVCCNCEHNKRTGEGAHIECHCDIDTSYIGYVKCMSYCCEHWKENGGEEK